MSSRRLIAMLFVLCSAATARTAKTVVISGRVVEFVYKSGIDGASVEAAMEGAPSQSTVSGRDGGFQLPAIPMGKKIQIRVSQLGYSPDPFTRPVTVSGPKVDVEVRLIPKQATNEYLQRAAREIFSNADRSSGLLDVLAGSAMSADQLGVITAEFVRLTAAETSAAHPSKSALKSQRAVLARLDAVASARTVSAFGQSGQGVTNPFAARETVVFQRKLPPLVQLPGSRVSVEIVSQANGTGMIESEVKALIEDGLVKSDRGISIDNLHPEAVIRCDLTSYLAPNLNVTTNASAVAERATGELAASYQATEAQSGRVLDSAVIQDRIDRNYQAANGVLLSKLGSSLSGRRAGAPPVTELSKELANKIASDVVSRIAGTSESISVPLARGKEFEDANNLARLHQWTKMQEELALSNVRDKAAWDYEMGVAWEAQAYEAPSPDQALRLAGEAMASYGKAVSARPYDKDFIVAQNRSAQTLARLTKPAGGTGSVSQASSGDALTNDTIRQMKTAGLPEDVIIDAIQSAPHAEFDLSPTGLIQLTRDGISQKVIAAMQAKK